MSPELDPAHLRTYFALMESVALLQHAVEGQLRNTGALSYVQFQLLARLADADDQQLTMTELADGVVYSRSGLTHQAGALESRGLVTRAPSPEDQRSTLVTITANGLELVARVLPGHVDVVRRLLLDPVGDEDLEALGRIMEAVRDHMRTEPPRSARSRRQCL